MMVQKGNNGIRRYRWCTEVIFLRSTILKSLQADTESGLHAKFKIRTLMLYNDKNE